MINNRWLGKFPVPEGYRRRSDDERPSWVREMGSSLDDYDPEEHVRALFSLIAEAAGWAGQSMPIDLDDPKSVMRAAYLVHQIEGAAASLAQKLDGLYSRLEAGQ